MENKLIKRIYQKIEIPIDIEITEKDVLNYIQNCYDTQKLWNIKYAIMKANMYLKEFGQPFPPDDDDDFRSRA